MFSALVQQLLFSGHFELAPNIKLYVKNFKVFKYTLGNSFNNKNIVAAIFSNEANLKSLKFVNAKTEADKKIDYSEEDLKGKNSFRSQSIKYFETGI